jgi:hypothetical protein
VRHLLVAGAELARLNWICNLHSIGPEWINGNRWRALLLSPSLRKTDRSPPLGGVPINGCWPGEILSVGERRRRH